MRNGKDCDHSSRCHPQLSSKMAMQCQTEAYNGLISILSTFRKKLIKNHLVDCPIDYCGKPYRSYGLWQEDDRFINLCESNCLIDGIINKDGSKVAERKLNLIKFENVINANYCFCENNQPDPNMLSIACLAALEKSKSLGLQETVQWDIDINHYASVLMGN